MEHDQRPLTDGHANLQMAGLVSARFRAGMRPLALGTALVVALSAPTVDHLLERHDQERRARQHAAEIGAHLDLRTQDSAAVGRAVNAAQSQRGAEDVLRVEVLDANRRTLFESHRDERVWPRVTIDEPLPRGLGRIRVTVGERELVRRDLLLLGVFGALGAVLGIALYYFPLRLFREEDLVVLFGRRSLKAAEDERLRLSRDLHDGIGQTLGAAAIALARLQARAGASEEASAAGSLIDRALDELRRVALGLRPPTLDDLGLGAAVHALARDAAGAGLRAEVKIEDFPRLDPELEQTCFRLAQEALSNIVRHARATAFQVALSHQQHSIVLEVSDDGRGFFPSTQLGLGLVGARERAARLGGTFQVESAPGRGTRFKAVLPFRGAES